MANGLAWNGRVTWYFENFDAKDSSLFLMYYTYDEEYDRYQQMLFDSGLWYGFGFSMFIVGTFELAKILMSQKDIAKSRKEKLNSEIITYFWLHTSKLNDFEKAYSLKRKYRKYYRKKGFAGDISIRLWFKSGPRHHNVNLERQPL